MRSMLQTARSKPTVALAIACVSLLSVLVVVSLVLAASTRSVSLDDARAEVTNGVTDLQDQLPLSAVTDTTDVTAVEPCPDGGSGQQARVDRSVTTAPGFDVPAWVREMSAKYNASEGWSARLRAVGSGGTLELKLVDSRLLIYTLTTGSAEHPELLAIDATSRCSVP